MQVLILGYFCASLTVRTSTWPQRNYDPLCSYRPATRPRYLVTPEAARSSRFGLRVGGLPVAYLRHMVSLEAGVLRNPSVSLETQDRVIASVRPTRRRFFVMALLFFTVVITYLDRSNLSIAAPGIARQFDLSPVQMGIIMSAFGWSYTPLQIPGGWLVDRVRPRVLYAAAILLWSLSTVGVGMAAGFTTLIVLRMAVGVFEVPSFLINNRIATTWFGEGERATCIAVYTAAEYVGLAFLTPLLAWLALAFDWRAIFFVTGGVALIWAGIWFACYREPGASMGQNWS
jgi:ACS family D-galactonate transporter-like MFS transporter